MINLFLPKQNNFIERSLAGALSFLKESIFSEEFAARKGFLQSLDPRVKTAAVFFLLAAMTFSESIPALLCFYLFSIVLAWRSRIDLFYFLKRTWIFIPLFSLFIAVPAVFDLFSPGNALFSFRAGRFSISVTHQGLSAALLFVTRVATAVSFAVLLTLTTKRAELLNALRFFRVPQTFVMVLSMCYRYIYLLVEIVENTYRAMKSRIGTSLPRKKGQKLVAWNMACLWQRSYTLHQAVYRAMLSRGYHDELRFSPDAAPAAKDWLWLLSAAAFSALVLFGFHFLEL